jgi:hypothetical protein
LGNVASLVGFRISDKDARIIAPELGIPNHLTLTDTTDHRAWIKLTKGGVPSSPVLIQTFPPQPLEGSFEAVRARTRARYARPREKVEVHIARSLS